MKDNNNVFIVRLVGVGDDYGRNFCLTNTSLTIMWSSITPATPFTKDSDFGYFIARYYKQNIMKGEGGLKLYGDDPTWQISDEGMEKVWKWLTN